MQGHGKGIQAGAWKFEGKGHGRGGYNNYSTRAWEGKGPERVLVPLRRRHGSGKRAGAWDYILA